MAATVIRFADGVLICDGVLDSSADAEFEYTEHPIDDASVISDHKVDKPRRLTMTLTCTDSPIKATDGFSVQDMPLTIESATYGRQTSKLKIQPKAGIQLNVSAAIGAIGNALAKAVGNGPPTEIEGLAVKAKQPQALSITVLAADTPVDRIHEFYERLLQLALAGSELTITFKGRDYARMRLTSVGKTDAPGEVGRSKFPVAFKEIRTVTTKQVKLPKVPQAKAKKDLGAKTSKAQNAEEKKRYQSQAVQLGIGAGLLSEEP